MPQYLVIGRGKLYIDSIFVGNVSDFHYSPQKNVLKRKSWTGGLGHIAQVVVGDVSCTGGFVTDYISAQNLFRFLDPTSGLHTILFVANNPLGPNNNFTFTQAYLKADSPHGVIGDSWQALTFGFEGIGTAPYPTTNAFTVLPGGGFIAGSTTTTTGTTTTRTTTSTTSH